MRCQELAQDPGLGAETLRVYAAGTSCTDVSAMGSGKGLFGATSKPLAVWMAELLHVQPDLWLQTLQTSVKVNLWH